MFLSFKEVLKA